MDILSDNSTYTPTASVNLLNDAVINDMVQTILTIDFMVLESIWTLSRVHMQAGGSDGDQEQSITSSRLQATVCHRRPPPVTH